MWEHYCKVEKDVILTTEGCVCNWCGDHEGNENASDEPRQSEFRNAFTAAAKHLAS